MYNVANTLSKPPVAMDSSSVSRASVLGFGVFQLDCQAGELRKSGVLVHLPPQPFNVLALLASRPGRVVTRKEIRRQIWGDETFVDFEHGLNHCIAQIRTALGDDAEAPRYIETLPRRGYRFMAPVETVTSHAEAVRGPLRYKWWVVGVGGGAVAFLALLLALNVAGLRNRLLGRATGPPEIHSIAVLPLENLSRDPDQEYFADGMTEELITTLGTISALRVISHTSVMRYKGTKKPLPQIARELNVDAIVEGTVERSGNRVRITANLLYAPADRHLWAQTYERNLGNVLSLQDEVARAIANQIRIKVTQQENARLAGARPVNPEAHRLYLLGRFYWNKRNEEGLTKAKEQFERAIEVDPTYAPAYAGLADSYLQLANSGVRSPNEAMPKAKAAARKALEIDPSLAQAHASLAELYKDYDWDWAGAEREFKRAIELDPNYATGHQWYAVYLSLMRRHTEAITEAQRAQQLDPLSPIISVSLAYWGGYFYARQYNESIRRLRETVSLFPEFEVAYRELGHACEANRMYQEAFVAFRKAELLSGASPAELTALDQAYTRGGMRGYYLWRIEKFRKESKHRYVKPLILTYLYAAIGDRDQAFLYMKKAYEDREGDLNTLQVEPWFDPLRSDPRSQAILRRMNFPK